MFKITLKTKDNKLIISYKDNRDNFVLIYEKLDKGILIKQFTNNKIPIGALTCLVKANEANLISHLASATTIRIDRWKPLLRSIDQASVKLVIKSKKKPFRFTDIINPYTVSYKVDNTCVRLSIWFNKTMTNR